jgi:predicted alpha/beta-fold hydrolase
VRVRLDTPDGDFLDLDRLGTGRDRLLVLTHGLEGHSRRPYMLGMARAAADHGWDVLAWNFRSCSGEPNRMLRAYHSGETADLAQVVEFATALGYRRIALCGFSIGGNKTLMYLGRERHRVPDAVQAAVVFSVPVDLSSCSQRLAEPRNRLYMQNFLHSFRRKLEQKQRLFPGQIDLSDYARIRDFHDYDSRYTAPMHGFASARQYWQEASSKPHLSRIERPVLMLSAADDPFLPEPCYPVLQVRDNPALTLEVTPNGGHVGFIRLGRRHYWSELRALHFLEQKVPAAAADEARQCPVSAADRPRSDASGRSA